MVQLKRSYLLQDFALLGEGMAHNNVIMCLGSNVMVQSLCLKHQQHMCTLLSSPCFLITTVIHSCVSQWYCTTLVSDSLREFYIFYIYICSIYQILLSSDLQKCLVVSICLVCISLSKCLMWQKVKQQTMLTCSHRQINTDRHIMRKQSLF